MAALALGSALLLPGAIVERVRSGPSHAAWVATPDDSRSVAVFELECDAGLFEPRCVRALELLTRELESDARIVPPVRSLARAAWVSAEPGALRPAPRVAPIVPDASDPEALRTLHARLHADPALAARFVRADERASFVVAELRADLPARSAREFAESVRARYERAPHHSASVRVELAEPARHRIEALLAGALGVACLALAFAAVGARLAAAAVLSGAAALFWYGGALAVVAALRGASSESALPVAFAAGACASLPLLHRARAELRRGAALDAAIASGLGFAAPPLALSFSAFVVTGALGALESVALLAALAAALLAAAALVPWLRGADEWRGLDRVLERALVRVDGFARAQPRALGAIALAVAVAALAGIANRPVEPAHPALPRAQRWWVDSGAAEGALEPVFLERVDALRRELESRAGVRSASTVVDAAIAPVERATHDGDREFATVPATRAQVEAALALFGRDVPGALDGALDAARRGVAIEAWLDPVPPLRASAARTAAALAVLFAFAAIWLRSLRAGVGVVVPAALAAGVTAGTGAALDAAALAASVAALCALLFLARARALAAAGAERSISLSLALRDAGRPAVALAVAACGLAAFGGSAATVVAPALGSLAGLTLAPALTRALGTRALARPEPLRAEVSDPVGSLRRRGTDARR